jgi:hypothetical protein
MTRAIAERDYVEIVRALVPGDWRVDGGPAEPWLRVNPPGSRCGPLQGWKLHLTASNASAGELLELATPVLVAARTPFKVAATPLHLATLNEGGAGASQIGKFVTVYPVDAASAVALARALDDHLGHLTGPNVPSDRPLRPGGVVWYRFGGFEARWIQLPHGEVLPAIVGPDGLLQPDSRRSRDAVPPWEEDPFVAAGLVLASEPLPAVIADRFLVVRTLHH